MKSNNNLLKKTKKLNRHILICIFSLMFFIFIGYIEEIKEIINVDVSLEEMKYCEQDNSCTKVSCDPCLGFMDTVNYRFMDKWYEKEGCTTFGGDSKNNICLGVAYPEREAVCQNNQCTLIEIKEYVNELK